VAIEEEGVSALVLEGGQNISLARVNLQNGAATRIATNLGAIGLGASGGVDIEPDGRSALAAVGGALITVDLTTREVRTLVFPVCGLANGLSGVTIEAGGNTVLLSHNICGILRVRIR
jgi:hypothetical protein